MGVPRGRRTKSKQGHRRSHLALKKQALTVCPRCGAVKRPHYACLNCGFYADRPVIDVFKKLSKREKKAKEKELEAEKRGSGSKVEADQTHKKELSLNELSKK